MKPDDTVFLQRGRMAAQRTKKLLKKIIILFFIFFIPSIIFAGTAHYVDCSAGTNGSGTYASPWNNIPSVNSHSLSTGDDVYFKVSTTCTVSTSSGHLVVDWDGNSGDTVVIGAYYGDGQFGLNGNARPIIDGQNTYPSTDYVGLIHKTTGPGYITVENLKIQNSNYHGINFTDQSGNVNIIVQDCHTYRTRGAGITFNYVDTGLIEDNIVDTASYNFSPGAAINVGAGFQDGSCIDVVVRGNVVKNSYEGIGLYKEASSCIVEKNSVYDNRSYQIYNASGSHDNIIRYNLVYHSSGKDPKRGIVISCESWTCGNIAQCSNDNQIYGNLIASAESGISLTSNCGLLPSNGNKIYNNTIVDSVDYNFRITGTGSGNEIKNNISRLYTSGSTHSNSDSPTGVTWDTNVFYGVDTVSGNAATNQVTSDPLLSKTSGWRSLTTGAVDGTEFALQDNSSAIDAGLSLGVLYDDSIDPENVNYTAFPITVQILDQDEYESWEIGAIIYLLSTERQIEGIICHGCKFN